jgi:D-alanyl-D-alanine carboxypeptidase/D-alanyl-D-alanine-endopeptidase (penicillin-binding protein 4)
LIAALALLSVSGCAEPRRVTVSPEPRANITPAPAATLQKDLAAIFDAPQFNRVLWSVLIRPVSSEEALYSLNSAKLVMPGSTMKILTAAAAAEALGWDHHFETKLATTAPIESGILRGDLVVVGGGDPSISERGEEPGVLRSMARQLRDAGVRQIEGGIVGDDDLFDDRGFGDGWTLDNLPYGYSAPITALEYNEGSVDLVIRAGMAAGDAVDILVKPAGSRLEVENRLVTAAETARGMLTIRRLPGSSHVIVEGQIPAKAPPFARTASVDNPTEFFVTALRNALITEGVEVTGDAIDIDEFESKPDLSSARTLGLRQSPPLSRLVTSMMKVSQNQYAELLLKAAGSGASGSTGASNGTSGTAEAGRKKIREVLSGFGIPDDGYIVVDGSGLSRYNYVTAETLVRILQVMHQRQPHASIFPSTLPIAGRDGTLAGRLAGTPAEGRVRAKTGTVDNVRAICGYVQTSGGEMLAFSIIANNFNLATTEIDAAADKALLRLVAFTGTR